MVTISLLIAGLLIGGIVGYMIGKQEIPSDSSASNGMNEDEKKKAENIQKIKEYIAGKDRFTNDELQNLIKVSDTTIGRYLDELEADGTIKQVGKTGRSVYYTKRVMCNSL